MYLQAVSDDSLSQVGEQRLFLAGYVNSSRKWELFSDAWAEELTNDPSIEYLKMAEAQSFRGPFLRWTSDHRAQKISSLARVIRHFRPMSFDVSVSVRDFNTLVKARAPYGLSTPYFPCLFGVVSSVSRIIHQHGPRVPIDFIFDQQQGVSTDFLQYFQYMVRNLPRGARKIVNGSPMFQDDRSFLPLQAADMLAWSLRRQHEGGSSFLEAPLADLIRGEEHVSMEIPIEALERWGDFFGRQNGVQLLRSKSQWRGFRSELKAQLDAGFIPPHGTWWKNYVMRLRELLARLLRF